MKGVLLHTLASCTWLLSLTAVETFTPVATRFVHRSLSRTKHSTTSSSVLKYADDESMLTQTTGSATKQGLFKQPWRVFDFNKDGKVNAQDIAYLATTVLDINGDGKIDHKDGQAALLMITLAWMLMVSPANAKGGGGGRGGGGGGGHYSSSYSYSSSEASYEPYRRPNRRLANRYSKTYRPLDPTACSDLPISGEVLDVLVDPGRGKYAPGIVTNVEEPSCNFQADLLRDKRSVQLASHQNFFDWIIPTFAVTIVGTPFAVELADQKWDEAFDDDFFDSEVNVDNKTIISPPPSGRYVGSTNESDGLVQEVNANLEFDEFGGIKGSGTDSEDGSYTVVGTWNNRKVRWTERYQGFETTVRGNVKSNGDVEGRFISTRGIRGKFILKKPKLWKLW